MLQQTSQTVTLALYASDRTEHGFHVGYDIFEITGHTVYQGEVVLTLKKKGWTRTLAEHVEVEG
jgi:hypothetical protein